MEENKKSNKGLIITIVCLIVLIVVLIGYVIFEKVLSNVTNKENMNETLTTKTASNSERKVGDCYDFDGNSRCVAFRKDNIEIEFDNQDDIRYYYYINNNKIFDDRVICDGPEPIVIDKNYVLMSCGGAELYYYFFNSKGEMSPLNFENINDVGPVSLADFSDNTLTLTSLGYIGDYEAALCRDKNEDDIVYIEQQIKYQGNGVFSAPKTIKTKNVKEVIEERYGMSCEELKTTNNPNLEYAKSLATGH